MTTTARPLQLFRHGGLYAASTLASAALSFLILPVYVRVLGKEGLGQVEMLQVATTVALLVIAQGLPAAWFRMRFQHTGSARSAFESVVFAYLAVIAAVALAVAALLGPWLTRWLTPEIPFYPLWLLSLATAALQVFGDVYATGLQAESRSLAYAVFMIARRVAALSLILWLLLQARWGVLGKVAGEAIAALGMVMFVLASLRPSLPSRSARPLLTAALAYGLPLLPHTLAMQLIAVADRFVLNHYLGLGAVGVYALGYRVASVIEAINGGLGNAYRALFMGEAAALDKSERPDAERAQQRQLAGAKLADVELKLLAAVSCGALLLATATRELLQLTRIDLAVFASAATVCYVVCWGLFAHAAYTVFAAPILYAPRGTARLVWISSLSALINLLGCIAFIPRAGLVAAAWATAAAHASLAAGAYLTGRQAWPLPRPWRRWGALFTCHSLALACGHALDLQVPAWPARLAAKTALVLAAAFVCARLANLSTSRWLAREKTGSREAGKP